jgi:hypothetical protein
MRTIEIDEDVWRALSDLAEPLLDTPNSVLRRHLLGAREARIVDVGNGSANTTRQRNRRGVLLPETEYFRPILSALEDRGGRAATREVIDAVGAEVRDRLTPGDFELTGNGNEVRWEMRVHFARLRMKERGLIKADSPRGTWEISEEGRRLLEAG